MKSESRDEFIRAAMQLFAQKGYHETSVDDIAEKASRSKGGFYYHFQSKDQIVAEIFNQMLKQTTDTLHASFEAGVPIKTVMMNLINQHEPIMKDRVQMSAGADFFFLALHDDQLAKIVKFMHDKMVAVIAEVIGEAVKRGELRADVDPFLTAKIFFAGARGIVWMHTIVNDLETIPAGLRYFVNQQFVGIEP